MALFDIGVLTKKGQALIAKAEAEGAGITFTRVESGSGTYSDTSISTLEAKTALVNVMQEFPISTLSTIPGNTSVAVITVLLNNQGLEELYYLTELGVYAEDPDEGEILYTLLVSSNPTYYMPPDNETGSISVITERIYIEVCNSDQTTIDTTGALASASDLTALQELLEAIAAGLGGGDEGYILTKDSSTDYDYSWKSINTVTRPYDEFPEEGRQDAIYVDTESSEIYVWLDDEYFKLPLGAEASETLQAQITALKARVEILEGYFDEYTVIIAADDWVTDTSDSSVTLYTQTITVADMTEDTNATLFPYIHNTDPSAVVNEMMAESVFFSRGIANSEDGQMVLTCYGRCPSVDFGITIRGVDNEA